VTEPQFVLSDEDERVLLAQFVDSLTHAEDSYDESIRVLAAGGVAVTASLATALHTLSGEGVAAVAAFLCGLGLTVASHQTARLDMVARINDLRAHRHDRLEESRWTRLTAWLNMLAGVALLAGGILLALFVSTSFK
jgi:hypothetical protein